MTASPASAHLPDVLALTRLDSDSFRAAGIATTYRRQALYGGQGMAQALLAAGATVETDYVPHSLHAYFLSSGESSEDYTLRVSRERDGARFANRRIVAEQGDKALFTMNTSFQVPSAGIDRQMSTASDVESPESLESGRAPLLYGLDYRVPHQTDAPDFPEFADLARILPTKFWVRALEPLPDDPLLHAALLAYVSDWSNGLVAGHVGRWKMSVALDHAMWFHAPHRLDEWTLFELTPQRAAGGRGWYTGHVYNQDGMHAATFTQEAVYGRIEDVDDSSSSRNTDTN
jgi:acyl-CoA thioesterase-2